jgi:hypothetical protein
MKRFDARFPPSCSTLEQHLLSIDRREIRDQTQRPRNALAMIPNMERLAGRAAAWPAQPLQRADN